MTSYFFRNLAVIWYLCLLDIFKHSAIFFGFQRLSKFISFGFLSPGHKSFLQFPSEFFLTFRIPYGLFSVRVFQNLAFLFKHTSNTVFLIMSMCSSIRQEYIWLLKMAHHPLMHQKQLSSSGLMSKLHQACLSLGPMKMTEVSNPCNWKDQS